MSFLKGFTLIEFLVIVAFFGLSVSIAVVILGSLRLKTRDIQQLHDARRLSDVNQLITGLDLFFSNSGGYPDAHLWLTGQIIGCDAAKILQVPKDPNATESPYLYQSKGQQMNSKNCGTKIWTDYSLQFRTERKSYLGLAGTYCVTSSKGIIAGTCPP